MSDPISLVKSNPLLPAEDYVALRKEGFKLIEQTGSAHWTEYNNSDPGITILEAVSYAITDLAYRTGFEMKDLLAPEHLTPETWKEIFYTARKILHNSALTLNDYRKVIIDIKGVRNAWIEPSKNYEVPLWINYNHFAINKESACGCGDTSDIGCYGKLVLDPVTEDQVIGEAIKNIEEEITSIVSAISEQEEKRAALEEAAGDDPDEKEQKAIDKLKKRIARLNRKKESLEKERTRLEGWNFIPSKIVELEGLYNVMVEYEEDVLQEKQRESVRTQVVDRLLKQRNLCEDFLSVNAVEYEDFGIAGSMVLEEDADPDLVLAQIYFTVHKYFSPSVPFYTIDQMIEKGYTIEEIFDGPALKHGFIETKELEKTDLYRDIRLSDLINEIADLSGIKAITFLRIPFSGFDQDEGGGFFNTWITFLREERKIARLQPSRSTMLFCKERDFITYNLGKPTDRIPDRMLKLFNDYKVMDRKYKLEGIEKDLPVPTGEFMELEEYFPVQYSLPMCYGVSDRAGLPAGATETRQVQALQLKGYLLFFEQLMADYLVQLNHIKDLFSFDNTVKKTYFTKVLTELDDLQKLVIDQQERGADHWDLILNDFKEILQHLVETPKTFNTRRNKFHDHLLARFGEDLSEYENLSRWLTPYKVEERLLEDKIRMLSNGEYYKISTNRGRGYNYAHPQFWDTSNVSGTERRISRLLGFKSAERRTLSPDILVIEPVMETETKKKHQGQKKNKEGKLLNVIKLIDPETKDVLLTSVEVPEGCCTDELMTEILTYADERKYFKFQDDLKNYTRKSAGKIGTFSFELWDHLHPDEAIVLAYSDKFESRKDREKVFKRLQSLLDTLNDNEGFHLVEHLLLRPRLDEVLDEGNDKAEVRLFDVCLDVCDLGKGLDEGELPNYRKKIRRIPARKCYDKMPWILEYFRLEPPSGSLLFQEAFADESKNIPLKFRRYEMLTKRVTNLRNFGSERINYEIVSNQEEEVSELKYSFIIYGEGRVVLAQSAFVYNKRTRAQIENDEIIDNDIEIEIKNLIRYFGFELDLYCAANPCDHNEDPYSFRATAVFPCWPKRFRDPSYRTLVEKTIQTNAPAHVHINVMWIGIQDMLQFEKVYWNWLKELSQTEMPSYEHVNPLVEMLDSLRPCGCCEDDCGGEGEGDHARSHRH